MFRRLFKPYAWVVTVDDILWGVFTSGEKAREAMVQWKLNDVFPPPEHRIRVTPTIADYRLTTAPPKYWSPEDGIADHPSV